MSGRKAKQNDRNNSAAKKGSRANDRLPDTQTSPSVRPWLHKQWTRLAAVGTILLGLVTFMVHSEGATKTWIWKNMVGVIDTFREPNSLEEEFAILRTYVDNGPKQNAIETFLRIQQRFPTTEMRAHLNRPQNNLVLKRLAEWGILKDEFKK